MNEKEKRGERERDKERGENKRDQKTNLYEERDNAGYLLRALPFSLLEHQIPRRMQ